MMKGFPRLLILLAAFLSLESQVVVAGPAKGKHVYPASQEGAKYSVDEFVNLVSVKSTIDSSQIIVRWQNDIPVLVMGHIPNGVIDFMTAISRTLSPLLGQKMSVTTDGSTLRADQPKIVLLFRNEANAASISQLLADMGYANVEEIERKLRSDKTTGACYSFVSFDSSKFAIVRSVAVLDTSYLIEDVSPERSIVQCILYNIFHSLGLLNNDAVEDSIVSSQTLSLMPTKKDEVYLRALYSDKLNPGPITAQTRVDIGKLLDSGG